MPWKKEGIATLFHTQLHATLLAQVEMPWIKEGIATELGYGSSGYEVLGSWNALNKGRDCDQVGAEILMSVSHLVEMPWIKEGIATLPYPTQQRRGKIRWNALNKGRDCDITMAVSFSIPFQKGLKCPE